MYNPESSVHFSLSLLFVSVAFGYFAFKAPTEEKKFHPEIKNIFVEVKILNEFDDFRSKRFLSFAGCSEKEKNFE